MNGVTGSRFVLILSSALLIASCAYRYQGVDRGQSFASANFANRGVVVDPIDNPSTPDKVALGRDLFNDARLSADGAQSCASCHQMERGLADGLARPTGRTGSPLVRHTPTLWNVAFAPRLFWDGRAATLEAQALMPVMSGSEMGRHPAAIIDPIRRDHAYRARFAAAFPDTPGVSEVTVSKAIAAYERTLVSGVAPFDRWVGGDPHAIGAAAQRGFGVFAGKGNCLSCHSGGNLTDGKFHDIGLPDADLGRGAITKSRRLDHAFRTPSLREIGQTAPYMHDGSLATLAEVVDHYSDRVVARTHAPRPARLTAQEQRDLVAFLGALDTER